MEDRNLLREQRAERVDTFGTTNKPDWTTSAKATAHYASITRILGELGEAKLKQLRVPVGKTTILDALWLDFKNVARTSRAIDQDESGFAAPFRLPEVPTELNIKTHADNLLKLLEDNNAPVADGGDTPVQKAAKAALRARFIEYFIEADFVEDLRADRDALDGKNVAKTEDNLEGVEGTKAIEVFLNEAATEVRHLNAMMQNLYARNPAKLQSWLAASRVERSSKKKAAVNAVVNP